MNRILTGMTILIIGLCSCKNAQQETYVDTSKDIPEDFLPFYEQFHLDTVFQVEHVHFPLEGMPALDPNSELDGFSFWWERIGWKYHKPYNDMGGTFSRTFNNFAGIITETIKDDSGQFSMVRRFSKMDGEWMLIYYKQLGR